MNVILIIDNLHTSLFIKFGNWREDLMNGGVSSTRIELHESEKPFALVAEGREETGLKSTWKSKCCNSSFQRLLLRAFAGLR